MGTVSSHIIETNGAEIRVVEQGAGEIALVFLHYWGGSARTWRPVMDRLGDQIRCIAVNQRGWGGSAAADERYDLAAMAGDVEDLVDALGLKRYVLVGHSMGGKVAQIVAARRPSGLAGLVLVAPAPPTPMPAPKEQRDAMLASYGSREGALQALSVLAGTPLPDDLREQVIEDTLQGLPQAKQSWPEHGMIEDISAGLNAVEIPVSIVVGSLDQVEHEAALREAFGHYLPQATFQILEGVGHLSPLEAPGELAEACVHLLAKLSPPAGAESAAEA